VLQAEANLQAAGVEQPRIEEVAADKGYHSVQTLELCQSLGLRTYIPEPKRQTDWTWTDKPPEDQRAVLGNRQRMRRKKGKQLQRLRSERCERSFAHVCETGGMRRSWLVGVTEVAKRYLLAAAAHNLGRLLWKLLGIGKPRSLQGCGGLCAALAAVVTALLHILHNSFDPPAHHSPLKQQLVYLAG
jgi:transposase